MQYFIDWFNRQPDLVQALFVPFVATLAGALIGWIAKSLIDAIARMRAPGPYILLMEPEEWQYIRWVPLESPVIGWNKQSAWANATNPPIDPPAFRIKNLGPEAVSDVRITWRVRSDKAIQDVVKNSTLLSSFRSEATPGNVFMLRFESPGQRGFGLPVMDVPHPVPWTHIYDYATWCSSYSSRAAIGV